MVDKQPQIGVLALQGAFAEHLPPLRRLGIDARLVRRPQHLQNLHGLIIPGGESTAIMHLMQRVDLQHAIPERVHQGMALWGACAGMILMAHELEQDRQPTLGLMDITVSRNWFGPQINSFEADLEVESMQGPPFRAVFIRAPLVTRAGAGVQTLATLKDGGIVAATQRGMLATAFHPELTPDLRFHRLFAHMARSPQECLN